MRAIFLGVALGLAAAPAMADQWVNGYFRNDGTYVQGHHRSSPNGNPYDNYSTQGNVNPYTGKPGTHSPYRGSNCGIGRLC
ncbi:hypothetical protein L2U69_11955 [Zavarzinia compransoris]|uniref:hypothetical protein n=1 Tax=Zavarzinia marina TaxID=2911065 RepID=UPI001F1BF7F4|nr:hypothetical protein [Zavarzinia marina]MCF4166360.1 hypothetical protein [Zavarzinia marina]